MSNENDVLETASETKAGSNDFYGRTGKFAICVLRAFSHKYKCKIKAPEEPVIYVCRHLNTHGPYTVFKNLDFSLHSMALNIFFDKEVCSNHYLNFTFSAKRGKKPTAFIKVIAKMSASIVVNVVQSLQAFPTYRDSTQSFKSFRYGMEFLMKGESLIVFPDIEYTNDYDKPSDIYTGFLYFGEMYYKKTGKPLKFIPVLIDDEKYEIIEREPLYINNFRNESERMREDLIKAINW
ncbi:MAG: hypothetical protein IJP33_03840 [Firmicutes bacterium]|nr:hypothetical protein [Bacillota bacterium]